MKNSRNKLLADIRWARQRQNALLVRLGADGTNRLIRAYQSVLPAARLLAEVVTQLPGDISQATLAPYLTQLQNEIRGLQAIVTDQAAVGGAEGFAAGVRGGIQTLQRFGAAASFGDPSIAYIVSAIHYVDSPAFQARVGQLAEYHVGRIADIILSAVANGRNPNETASLITQYFVTSQSPLQDAIRLARTTQLYSMREGTRQVYAANGITEWLWSAAIGDIRTCIACIFMDGTIHPVSELLNDHHNGRCAPIPITPTWASLGYTSGEDLFFQTGEEWFLLQDTQTQEQLLGNQLYQAWDSGRINLSVDTVVGNYQNDIFGVMRRRRTNAEILEE